MFLKTPAMSMLFDCKEKWQIDRCELEFSKLFMTPITTHYEWLGGKKKKGKWVYIVSLWRFYHKTWTRAQLACTQHRHMIREYNQSSTLRTPLLSYESFRPSNAIPMLLIGGCESTACNSEKIPQFTKNKYITIKKKYLKINLRNVGTILPHSRLNLTCNAIQYCIPSNIYHCYPLYYQP
jgi:hypothetical protein